MNINDLYVLKHWSETKWVVTIPTSKSSTMGDVIFETSPYELALQIEGGLIPATIFLITSNEGEAKNTAQKLLDLKLGIGIDKSDEKNPNDPWGR